MPILIEVDPAISLLIPIYLKKKQTDLALLKESLTNSDFKTIENIGHQMKGSAASYGFAELTEIGNLLEKAARNQDSSAISGFIDFIQNYLSDVKIAETNSSKS